RFALVLSNLTLVPTLLFLLRGKSKGTLHSGYVVSNLLLILISTSLLNICWSRNDPFDCYSACLGTEDALEFLADCTLFSLPVVLIVLTLDTTDLLKDLMHLLAILLPASIYYQSANL